MVTPQNESLELVGRNLIVFFPPVNFPYYYYLKSILNFASSIGMKSRVIILEDFEFTERSLIYRVQNANFERKIRDEFLQKIIEDASDDVVIEKINVREFLSKVPEVHFFSRLKDLETLNSPLYNSIRSVMALSSVFSWHPNYKLFFFKKQVKGHAIDFLSTYKMVEKIIGESGPFTGIFLNGRHPSQAAIRHSLELQGVPFLSLEHGMPELLRFNLDTFQVQEVIAVQEKLLHLRKLMNKEERRAGIEFAKNWLDSQQQSREQNSFLRGKASDLEVKFLIQENKLGVIYTSSIDETINNLGNDTNGWESQSQAICAAATEFRRLGIRPVVRIHPNSENKAIRDLLELTINLTANGIDYILPWEEIDSYKLLEVAQIVGTWGSTIGIEAAARGIPVFVLGRSEYARMSRITEISPGKISEIEQVMKKQLDIEAILLSIYQMKNQGFRIANYLTETDRNNFDEITRKFQGEQMLRRKIRRRLNYFFLVSDSVQYSMLNRFITGKAVVDIFSHIFTLKQSYFLVSKLVKLITWARLIILRSNAFLSSTIPL
jgi:hypothetical protein